MTLGLSPRAEPPLAPPSRGGERMRLRLLPWSGRARFFPPPEKGGPGGVDETATDASRFPRLDHGLAAGSELAVRLPLGVARLLRDAIAQLDEEPHVLDGTG